MAILPNKITSLLPNLALRLPKVVESQRVDVIPVIDRLELERRGQTVQQVIADTREVAVRWALEDRVHRHEELKVSKALSTNELTRQAPYFPPDSSCSTPAFNQASVEMGGEILIGSRASNGGMWMIDESNGIRREAEVRQALSEVRLIQDPFRAFPTIGFRSVPLHVWIGRNLKGRTLHEIQLVLSRLNWDYVSGMSLNEVGGGIEYLLDVIKKRGQAGSANAARKLKLEGHPSPFEVMRDQGWSIEHAALELGREGDPGALVYLENMFTGVVSSLFLGSFQKDEVALILAIRGNSKAIHRLKEILEKPYPLRINPLAARTLASLGVDVSLEGLKNMIDRGVKERANPYYVAVAAEAHYRLGGNYPIDAWLDILCNKNAYHVIPILGFSGSSAAIIPLREIMKAGHWKMARAGKALIELGDGEYVREHLYSCLRQNPDDMWNEWSSPLAIMLWDSEDRAAFELLVSMVTNRGQENNEEVLQAIDRLGKSGNRVAIPALRKALFREYFDDYNHIGTHKIFSALNQLDPEWDAEFRIQNFQDFLEKLDTILESYRLRYPSDRGNFDKRFPVRVRE